MKNQGVKVIKFRENLIINLMIRHAINKICRLDTHLTATGDDEGIIKVR